MQKVRRWETITPILPPHPLCQSICMKRMLLLFDIQCTHCYKNEEHCNHYLKRFLKSSRSKRQQCKPCVVLRLNVKRTLTSLFLLFFHYFLFLFCLLRWDNLLLTLSLPLTHTHTRTRTNTQTLSHSLPCASECGIGTCVRAKSVLKKSRKNEPSVGSLLPGTFSLFEFSLFFTRKLFLFVSLFFLWDVFYSSHFTLLSEKNSSNKKVPCRCTYFSCTISLSLTHTRTFTHTHTHRHEHTHLCMLAICLE